MRKKSKDEELLVYTGSIPKDYMLLNGKFKRAMPGESVMTPGIFVEARLEEGEWERSESTPVKPKVQEKEGNE